MSADPVVIDEWNYQRELEAAEDRQKSQDERFQALWESDFSEYIFPEMGPEQLTQFCELIRRNPKTELAMWVQGLVWNVAKEAE